MHSPLDKLVGAAAAFALFTSSTTVAAAATAAQPLDPLIAVSLLGTQASAEAVCSQTGPIASAGAAAAAQAQSGCVLPASDLPPPAAESPAAPPVPGANYGVNWLLAALGLAALIGGLSTLFDDDDVTVSPA